jgi:preprotein translocase subunit SecF
VKKRNVFGRLYHGETDIDFIGRWKLWFAISGLVILIGLAAFAARGLNLGIDFTGGNVWQVAANDASVQRVTDRLGAIGIDDTKVQTVGDDLRVQTPPFEGTAAERERREAQVVAALSDLTGVPRAEIEANQNTVGPSWGEEISEKALRALVFFLVAIAIYIAVRFEFRMSVATLVALVHDLLVVLGIYALFQLQVTPATVIAILTILGFSIYDGIVVFDRVDENTRVLAGAGRMTYSDMTNLSLNQVLMRSLNTSITALLPITSVLIIGAVVLGASTLEEFGLALLVGQLSGAYSSLFIASPMLALLKEREPRYQALRKRLEERGERTARRSGRMERAEAETVLAQPDDEGGPPAEPAGDAPALAKSSPSTTRSSGRRSGSATSTSTPPRPSGAKSATHPPRPRKKGKRR